MNKGIGIILLVAVLGMGAYAWVTSRENARLRLELAELNASRDEAGLIGAVPQGTGGEEARLAGRVAELEEALAVAKGGEGAGKDDLSQKAPAEKKGRKGMMLNLSKMMDDPAMAAMIEQQQGVMIDGLFGPLFAELGLGEAETAAVRDLILEKQMVATRLGLQMMDEGITKDERAELTEAIKAETDRVNLAIKDTLGEEGYAEFELFEKSQPERQALQAYKQSLTGQGIELSFDQEEALMSAMYEERTNFSFSSGDFGDQSQNDPELLDKFTEANVEQYLGEYRQLQERIAERVSGILSDDQLEAFKANQESMVKMQEMGMRMGLGMMGQQGDGGDQ